MSRDEIIKKVQGLFDGGGIDKPDKHLTFDSRHPQFVIFGWDTTIEDEAVMTALTNLNADTPIFGNGYAVVEVESRG